ncbi:MAG: HAMP domain-containing histidine kinase [Acidimicrobiales bacterium]|nr:HAMP domain-containing histidine kinase [Acidimicrobiales bacterium]
MIRNKPTKPSPTTLNSVVLVALEATVAALLFYFLLALIGNALFEKHLTNNLDRTLNGQLSDVSKGFSFYDGPPTLQKGGKSQNLSSPDIDLDAAPVVVWWIPATSKSAIALSPNWPTLPSSLINTTSPLTVSISHINFRIVGKDFAGGHLIAGSTTNAISKNLHTLELAEEIFAPIFVGTFFLLAFLIGRSAAKRVDRIRRRQLDFTADASHELRTPIAVIEAEVDLSLSHDRDASEYRSSLVKVQSETERLKKTVENLLWLARVDSDPRAEIPENVLIDLSDIVTTVVDVFKVLAEAKSIALNYSEDSANITTLIEGPPEWIDQLARVLIDNAIKYTPSSGQVRVSTTLLSNRVNLTVEDSGPGIPIEERQAIFDRFVRASKEPSGSGLGLAMMRSLSRPLTDQSPSLLLI